MQKTSNGKKTFLPIDKLRPSQNLSKSLQKIYHQQHKINTQPIQSLHQQQTINKLKRNTNFQYYFYDKFNSTKQLNQLRNSQSVKNLLQTQRKKQSQLNQQIQQKQRQIIELQNQFNNHYQVPFYKKFKPQPISNDPQLADYGQFFGKINLKRQKSPSHNFQKLKQNKHNLYKYRQTRGMISPQKLQNQENAQNNAQIDINISSKYNRTLSPFQFRNTIQGQLLTRSNRNIRMDLDKTHKINNVNKIWYKTNKQSQKQQDDFRKMRKSIQYQDKIKKCHSFDSYKGHKLFQSRLKKVKTPADQKFYNADGLGKHMPFFKKWKTQNHINMQLTTDRPKLPQKLGTNLDYQIQSPKLALKSPSKKYRMGISSSQRNLKFTRQIINSAKGCYR